MDSVNAISREAPDAKMLESSIASARQGVLGFQQPDGHWVFELEADCTIPAEYILLRHYLADDGWSRTPRQEVRRDQFDPRERQARRHQEMPAVKAAFLAGVDDGDLAARVVALT